MGIKQNETQFEGRWELNCGIKFGNESFTRNSYTRLINRDSDSKRLSVNKIIMYALY